jgi:hypothetical protein
MLMLLLPLAGRRKPAQAKKPGPAGRGEVIGSFEKAVPVIFWPRDEKRWLFPWLLTGLNPFCGTSERADGGG